MSRRTDILRACAQAEAASRASNALRRSQYEASLGAARVLQEAVRKRDASNRASAIANDNEGGGDEAS